MVKWLRHQQPSVGASDTSDVTNQELRNLKALLARAATGDEAAIEQVLTVGCEQRCIHLGILDVYRQSLHDGRSIISVRCFGDALLQLRAASENGNNAREMLLHSTNAARVYTQAFNREAIAEATCMSLVQMHMLVSEHLYQRLLDLAEATSNYGNTSHIRVGCKLLDDALECIGIFSGLDIYQYVRVSKAWVMQIFAHSTVPQVQHLGLQPISNADLLLMAVASLKSNDHYAALAVMAYAHHDPDARQFLSDMLVDVAQLIVSSR